MQSLKGKKLLLSGGVIHMRDAVEKARQMGMTVGVTDYLEDSPCKEIADESYMVSTRDIPAMVQLIKRKQFDGVFTGAICSNLPFTRLVCDAAGLPFYATMKQITLLSNKHTFKTLCRKHGINVVPEFSLTDEFLREDLARIRYPVLVKPVDSSGARGITVCHDEYELRSAYQTALSFSPSKNLIVEQYMDGEYVTANFGVQNGYLTLSSVADKPVNSDFAEFVRLPGAYIFPSRYVHLIENQVYPGFRRIAEDIGLDQGTLDVEGIVYDGRVYLYEMQFRTGGMRHYKFVERENGVDYMGMHLRYAVTGSFEGHDIRSEDNPHFRRSYALVNLLLSGGVVKEYFNFDEVAGLPGVFWSVKMKRPNDQILPDGSMNHLGGKLAIEADTKEELYALIRTIQSTMVVFDENRRNMVMDSMPAAFDRK